MTDDEPFFGTYDRDADTDPIDRADAVSLTLVAVVSSTVAVVMITVFNSVQGAEVEQRIICNGSPSCGPGMFRVLQQSPGALLVTTVAVVLLSAVMAGVQKYRADD